MTLTLDGFENFLRFYRGHPWQREGVAQLYESLRLENVDLLNERHQWVMSYRGEGGELFLSVPYELQHDNKTEGYRECFSSSVAMVARYHGADIANDDEYIEIRQKYGDTTDPQAHVSALNELGLFCKFHQDGSVSDLERLLYEKCPIPVGWLHRGSVNSPQGSGHWSVITGMTPTHWRHADPNGEADMIRGGYLNHTAGKDIDYTRNNWEKRWAIEGPGSGWYLEVRP